MELLGSTETTGPQSACLPGAGTRPASVGGDLGAARACSHRLLAATAQLVVCSDAAN